MRVLSSPTNVITITAGSLQIISAIEAMTVFGLSPDETIVLASRGALKRISQIDQFPNVELVEIPAERRAQGSSRIRNYALLAASLRAAKRATLSRGVSRFFFGTNGMLAKAIWNSIPSDSLPVILEDGTASLRGDRIRELHDKSIRASSKQLLARVAGLDFRPIPRLAFFTPFDVQVGECDTIIHNDFRALRAHGSGTSEIDSQLLLIVGTPVYSRQSRLDEYEQVLKQVAERFPADRTVYKPHPGEKQLSPFARDRVVSNSELPLELLVLGWQVLPGTIIGFGSTALHTLSMILPDNVRVLDFSDLL